MSKLITITVKQADYEPVPTDVYNATLTSLQVVANPFKENSEQLQWEFTIRGGQYDGRTLRCYTSLSGSPKSKLVAYASVLLGKSLQPNDEIDLNALIGKNCRILLRQEPRRDGSGFFNKIESLLPAPQQAQNGQEDPFE